MKEDVSQNINIPMGLMNVSKGACGHSFSLRTQRTKKTQLVLQGSLVSKQTRIQIQLHGPLQPLQQESQQVSRQKIHLHLFI